MSSKLNVLIYTIFCTLLPIVSFAQINPAPITGTTTDFLLFTGAGAITNAGTTSTYFGSIGTNAGTLVGFESLITQPTNLYSVTKETAQCAVDLNILYTDLASRTGTNRVGVYGSETLAPGVYTTVGAISVATDLTLDGNGDQNARFIIKTGGAFTMAATAKIILTNGTQAKNVYWVIAGAASVAANCEARGIFICLGGAISMGANATMQGSAMTMAGAITTVDGMHLSIASPPASNTMVLLGNQEITSGTTPADLVLAGNISPVIKWQSASNSTFTNPIDILHYSEILSFSCTENINSTTFYRAVIAVDGIDTYSNSIKITVNSIPNLAAAGPFVLYSGAGAITNTGSSSYLSSIGTQVGALTGFPNPTDPLLHTSDPLTLKAKEDLQELFTTINAYPTTNSSHPVAFGSSEILLPGVYSIGGAATLRGKLTLDGQNNIQSLFIIKINGAFALAAATEIILINGAATDSVFWLIDGALSLGVNSIANGTFICKAGAIAIANNCLIHGRMFTLAGAITLANSKLTYAPSNTYTDSTIITSGNQSLTPNTIPSTLTITGNIYPVVRWEKSSNILFTNPTVIPNPLTTLTGLEIGAITEINYCRAVMEDGTITIYSPLITLSVSAITIPGILESNQLLCANSQPHDLVLTGNTGSITKWQSALSPDFSTPIDIVSSNATLTGIEIGAIKTTTYFRAVVQNCTSSIAYSNIVTLAVTSLPSGGIISSNQDFCSPSQPSTLNLSGNTTTVVKWQSSLTSDFLLTTDIINTTSTLTGSSIGIISSTTYFRAVTNDCNLSFIYSSPAVITIAAVTIWNGSSWSNGLPSFSNSAIFNGNFTASADIQSCSITVNSDVAVIVDSGHNITLNGGLTIDPSGSFTLNNDANLLQPEGAINNGIITVKRNSAPLYRLDSTLWSSPVSDQNLKDFSNGTLTNRFYFYDSTASVNGAYAPVFNNSFFPEQTVASYSFETGKGYLIRSPNTFATYIPAIFPATKSAVPGISYQAQFTGTPNNGTINSSLSTALNGYNLVGNPYPSSISVETFLKSNSAAIDGTIWLWRKINDLGTGVGYATLTNAGLTSVQPDVNEGISTGTVAIGQGFFVKVKRGLLAANLQFNNSMRSRDVTHTFFKNINAAVSEKHRIWLNLANTKEVISQNLIGYITGATNGVDYSFEGKVFEGIPTSLSSIVDNTEYNIQARSLPFDPNDVVPLNFRTNVAGMYTISIDHVDGLFETNQAVILRDNLTGNLQNLKLAAYSFDSQVGNFNTRFEIIYQKQLVLDEPSFDANNVIVYKQNNTMNINSGSEIMDKIEIYDIIGRLLYSKDNITSSSIKLQIDIVEKQILIMKITTINHKIINKKLQY
ncbi:hypothetical protein FFWV33_16795 [Flavobacterium faecale]|uniref:Ig-like domain-containing protein n=1 Tax=Flavobacterium faecale TaxID=1355330 RepID=A0A2S1LGZ2_9FLAO|nr:ice-binding family protein [Flavobacterium faecale]AWG23062.1 hypothetical protein FFWV33_16795 [Flavobacterium faecale]